MTSSSKETKSEAAICRLTPAVTFFEMLPSFDRLPLFVCQILPGGNDDDDDDDVVVVVAAAVFFAEPAVSS